MKKNYIKPEVELIDISSREALMSAEDAIFFGLGDPYLEGVNPELSYNDIWDE